MSREANRLPFFGGRFVWRWLATQARSSVAPRTIRLVCLLAGACFLACSEAAAIDVDRALTQALQRIWQPQQGLPSSPIEALLQTDDGYLWLGTQKGLFLFDGTHFTPAPPRPGIALQDIWVRDLAEDTSHTLWVATDGAGLIALGPNWSQQFGRRAGLPSDDVNAVLADAEGRLWVATNEGLAMRAADSGSKEKTPPIFQVVHAGDLRAVCQMPDGKICSAGAGNELLFWDGRQTTTRPIHSLPHQISVRALLPMPDGTLWIGTSDGLVRWEGDSERLFTTADGLAQDSVLSLARGGGVVWIGTKDGFSRFNRGEIETFGTRDGLSQSTVYALCEDHEGSLWVGTKHGLNQFVDRRTVLFTVKEGLPSNDAGPVLQDAHGAIWVGSLGAGLGRFDGRRFSVLTTENGLASNTILSLATGEGGSLWVGTTAGLNHLSAGQVDATYTAADGLPSGEVRAVCRDSKGMVWVGTSAGLVRFQDGKFAAPADNPGAFARPIRALVEHRRHEILAAVDNGGVCSVGNEGLEPWGQGKLDGFDVETFFEDVDGLLWMGTQASGLLLVDGEKIHHFTSKNGLYDDDIFGIVADDEDRLWMACSKGIFYVSRLDLRKFVAGEIQRLVNIPFSPMDALRTIECKGGVQPAVWKMKDGQVWFSTMRGLIVIEPDRLQRQLPPMPVVVEEIIVNGKQETPGEMAHLPPGSTNLEFRYAALSYVAPSRIMFRYRLEGFDSDWINAGTRRQAFYTNLPPGRYRFDVAAQVFDGPWEQNATPVALEIEPHFYQTRWFVPVVVFLAGLAVWAAYRMRVRRIKEHLQLVLAERSRIARELHDTLMQGFSGVTMEMQALSARLAPSAERRTLEEIIRDAGICLREARRSVAGLRTAGRGESGLSAAIARAAQQLTEMQDVRLKLDLERSPQGLADDVQYNLLRIAQEAVSNAVKHSGGRTIEVGLHCTDQRLRLSVHDDGFGLALPDGNRPQPGHYGLIGMRERASQIGAELRVESAPGQGTTVCVSVPIQGGSHGLADGAEIVAG